MKLHFANSARIAAPERAILRDGRLKSVQLNVRYGLVIYPDLGSVLIDTGYTDHCVTRRDRSTALRIYNRLLRPNLLTAGQPVAVLARFGHTLDDVRFVIVTHFHADHVSGLSLFKNAQFIVSDAA